MKNLTNHPFRRIKMETPFFEVTHYINGEFVNSPLQFEKLYPATNQVIGTVAEGKQAEVDRAVSAAKNAFKTWGKMSASQRRPILRAFAEGIRKNADELARIETFDVGRAIR
ncbi:MAG: aldehyde dehydrogenase family protein, partial [Anaerolineae bacterium]|nr:aldehyde dehydrogenase family protein [Anaerolineae bacterium]